MQPARMLLVLGDLTDGGDSKTRLGGHNSDWRAGWLDLSFQRGTEGVRNKTNLKVVMPSSYEYTAGITCHKIRQS
jgi:hypothetical protein